MLISEKSFNFEAITIAESFLLSQDSDHESNSVINQMLARYIYGLSGKRNRYGLTAHDSGCKTLKFLVTFAVVFYAMAANALGLKMIKGFPNTPLSSAKVWNICTYGDGWAFFAAQDGMLQYDGSSVLRFDLNNRHPLRSVNLDSVSGRLYAGGINEFGYFEPSPRHSLEYVCLSDSVGNDRHIGNIWGIYSEDGKTTAQGDAGILVYDSGKRNHILIDTGCKLDCSAMADGVLWLGTDKGLKFLLGNRVVDAPGAELLEGARIRAIFPYEGDILVVTAGNGVYRYDRQRLVRLEPVSAAALRLGEVFSADFRGRMLALGSIDYGVGVVDIHTGDMKVYDENSGLENNTVLSVKFDMRGDLWAALDPGVAHILLTMPVETFNNCGLPIGSGYVLAETENKLYLGTNRGLFYVAFSPGADLKKSEFHSVAGMRGQVWGLSKVGDDLFCSHDRGLFVVKDGVASKVGDLNGVWDVQQFLKDPDRMYAGTYFGVDVLGKRAGIWEKECHLAGYDGSCYNFVQESAVRLWTADGDEGVYRLHVDTADMKVVRRQNFKLTSDGFPLTSDISLSRIDNDVCFATPFGIYRYDSKSDEIIPDERLSLLLGTPRNVRRVKKKDGWLYALTDRELRRADPAGILQMRRISLYPPAQRPMHDGELLFCVASDRVAYPTPNGYVFFDFSDDVWSSGGDSIFKPLPKSRISRVAVSAMKDSTIYQGNFLGKKDNLRLRYAENSIKIEFGSIEESASGIRYSCRLNGGKWSSPSASGIKEYTNLKEGDYFFEVKAIGVDGRESVDSIRFSVSPPWWRSIWAIACYLVLSAFMAWGIVLLERRRVNRRQQALLKEKDAELARQQADFEWESKLKDHKIVALQKEQLDKELRHKAQEMADVMMSLTHKNETLQTVKRELQNILPLLPRSSSEARKAIVDLQGKVTVDLKSDDVLKRVEEEFDLVHNDFIKKLRESYPDLTNNEILMCAYLKLNLSTKEIAPLLNISVRGVETMRYRIRKKFNLEREENLNDFLSKRG